MKINLVGKKFGRLLVIKFYKHNKKSDSFWICRCNCGNETISRGADLKNNKIKSCGCLQKEITIKRSTVHGYKSRNKTMPLYSVWQDMKKRCNNPSYHRYKDWGGRGIKVCERWQESDGKGFLNFLSDMGDPPKGLTLDRINNNLGYFPKNCRWSTPLQQSRNNRRKKKLLPLR